jgi:hypothetical protein
MPFLMLSVGSTTFWSVLCVAYSIFHEAASRLQWRETRTIGDKIKDLKKQLPAKESEGEQPTSPLDVEIKSMEAVRTSAASRLIPSD